MTRLYSCIRLHASYLACTSKLTGFKMSPVLYEVIIAISVAAFAMNTGMAFGWSSPVLVKLRSNDSMMSRPVTADEGTWLVSVVFILAPIFVVIFTILSDCIGRKPCLYLGCLFNLISNLFLLFGSEFWMLMLARAFVGVSCGPPFVIAPVYLAEIVNKRRRGALCSLLQLFLSLGVVFMYILGPYLQYRTLHLIFTAVGILNWIPLFFIPETPYFLYSKGKHEASAKVLFAIRESDLEVSQEMETYAHNMEAQKKEHFVKDKTFITALIMVFVFGVLGQLTGFNLVSHYMQTIFESTDACLSDRTMSLIIGFVQFLSVSCPILLTDKCGRKPVLIVTTLLISLGMLGLSVLFWFKNHELINSQSEALQEFFSWLPLASVVLINIGYSAGFGSLFFVIVPELFKDRARTIGSCAGNIAIASTAFVITKGYHVLLDNLGSVGTYGMFSGLCLLFCLFVWIFVPETKNRSFEDIQQVLKGK